jgi:hypothetical protein
MFRKFGALIAKLPSVFLRCMSLLFHTVLVTLLSGSLVVLSSPVSIFPFAHSIFLILPSRFRYFKSPSHLPFYFVGLMINQLLLISLSVTIIPFHFILSVLCLVPCPGHLSLLLCRVGVAFVERPLSLLILFTILFNRTDTYICMQTLHVCKLKHF